MALEFPQIDPVAISLGPVDIRWYALAYLAGFVFAWWYAMRLAGPLAVSEAPADKLDKDAFKAWKEQGPRPNRLDIEDFLTYALIGVILGGRLGYVLFYNFDRFLAYPGDILKVWQGGMSFHGGVIGVVLAILLFSWIRKVPTLKLADIVVCTAPIGLFLGRVANFINGELYGRVSDVAWAVKFPSGGGVPRHPSQLYEAILEGLVLFVILWGLSRMEAVKQRPGILAGVFLIGYGAFRAFVELFREADAHIGYFWGAVSMGQILCLPMILFGIALIVYSFKAKNSS